MVCQLRCQIEKIDHIRIGFAADCEFGWRKIMKIKSPANNERYAENSVDRRRRSNCPRQPHLRIENSLGYHHFIFESNSL